ncbi:hypothetical protein NW069_04520 [Mycoplasmopsis cynos]|uniref:hypothetical protein n=1 Tax=Mycoplasmopsis cynos TaxID=171284 RepID=UPI0021FF397F|nr:hypothetical protein [Mycoplasmopsis cynos]UWV80543.1 hypothetical protein NW069_04520 [Mycoplasmopsis cynos]
MQKNLKNDYYDAINHDWLKQAKIPEDRSQIGSFVEMDIKLEKLLKDTINGWYKDSKTLPNDPLIHEYVKYYSMLLDDQKRAELGWKPVKKYLNTLEKISSFKELFQKDVIFEFNMELYLYQLIFLKTLLIILKELFEFQTLKYPFCLQKKHIKIKKLLN